MVADLTLDEVWQAKAQMETEILEAIERFQEKTGMGVGVDGVEVESLCAPDGKKPVFSVRVRIEL